MELRGTLCINVKDFKLLMSQDRSAYPTIILSVLESYIATKLWDLSDALIVPLRNEV